MIRVKGNDYTIAGNMQEIAADIGTIAFAMCELVEHHGATVQEAKDFLEECIFAGVEVYKKDKEKEQGNDRG